LFFLVRRANVLPFGGELDDLAIGILGARLGARLEAARQIDRVVMNDEARTLWSDLYAELSAEQPGLLGATIARAEAQVVRLSLLYALLDAQMVILPEHLRAALALWNYAAHSARRIFGDMQGDPVADGILTALRNAGAVGMTRNEMMNLFGRNLHSHHIARALTTLEHLGIIRRVAAPPGAGRPPEIWRAV
jgi:hypothetical protein